MPLPKSRINPRRKKSKSTRSKTPGLLGRATFSRKSVIAFVVVFAVLGGIIMWRAFAATTIASLEAESMTVASGTPSAVVDSASSAGSYLAASSTTTLNGSTTTSVASSDISIRAKSSYCRGTSVMAVAIDDGSAQDIKVTNTSGWLDYSIPASLTAGSHKVTISFTNPYSRRNCVRKLYLDVVTFNGEAVVNSIIPTSTPLPSGITGYSLKWSDEFDGTALDPTKWNVINNSNFGSSNQEDECYLSGNTSVGDGVLSLTAKQETVGTCPTNPQGFDRSKYFWTSGMVTTQAMGGPLKYKFTQGYIEARIKAPSANAYWPAFWLVSSGEAGQPSWPAYGEFDVSELYGAVPDNTFGTLHYSCSTGHCKTSPNAYNIKADNYSIGGKVPPLVLSSTNDWHTYGLLWTTDRLTWYVDGKPRLYFDGLDNTMHTVDANGNSVTSKQFTPPTASFWDIAHSIHLNLAVGGNGPAYFGYTGAESVTSASYDNGNLVGSLPASMQVDYVRVWQK